jgi:hypothetical protein
MDINEKIVREEFGAMCKDFHLVIEKVGDGEIALIGAAFLLLIWLDREGVSVKYVRSASSRFQAIDLGRFIALKRGWVGSDLQDADEDIEARLRRECSSYAVNLQRYAEDILQGETKWMKDVSVSASVLSDLTGEAIEAAIERSGKSKEI